MAQITGFLSAEETLRGEMSEGAITPEITTEEIDNGYKITIKDKNGTQSVELYNGEDGIDGTDGEDGVSPTVTIESIEDGYTIIITDADGDHSFSLFNGQDGHTPQITASKSGNVTTISVDGTPIATITDGAQGQPGADGHTPVITATKSGKVTTIYSDGVEIATINDGADGQDGQPGQPGADGQDATAAIITMTYSAHDDWTCDTTFDDVMSYIADGRVVFVKMENFDIDGNVYDDVYLPLAHYDSTLAEFEGIYQQYDLYAQLADDDSVPDVGFGFLPTSTEIPPIVETVIQGIGYAESLYF